MALRLYHDFAGTQEITSSSRDIADGPVTRGNTFIVSQRDFPLHVKVSVASAEDQVVRHTHEKTILLVKNLIIPMAYDGVLFNFDHGVWGTGGGRVHYPADGYVVTMRPREGKYGGALAIEEATENLIQNGHFENGEGVPTESGSNPVNEIVKHPNPGASGWVLRQTSVGGHPNTEYEIRVDGLEPNTTYCMSCWVAYTPDWDGRNQIFHARWYRTDGTNSSTTGRGTLITTVQIDGLEWEYRYLTFTTNELANGSFRWYVGYPAENTQGYRYLTNLQLEAKPFPTSFVDGSREAGRLEYPSIIPSNEGTLSIWAKKNTLEPGTRQAYRKIFDAASPRIDFQWSQHGDLSANFGGASISAPDPAQDLEWHMYTITYSGRTVKMYFDGRLVASGESQQDLVDFTSLMVGSRQDGAGVGNALYDELLVLSRAASDEEIMAWYTYQSPMIDVFTPVIVSL